MAGGAPACRGADELRGRRSPSRRRSISENERQEDRFLPDADSCIARFIDAAFHAIMVIGEPGTQKFFSPSTLQTVFDLTPAEAKLAVSIGNGEDLSTYAKRAGLSKTTVRNQLKSVFAKVGVSRQADLTATLAGLMPDGG